MKSRWRAPVTEADLRRVVDAEIERLREVGGLPWQEMTAALYQEKARHLRNACERAWGALREARKRSDEVHTQTALTAVMDGLRDATRE